MQIINHNLFHLEDFKLSPAEFLLKRKERPKPLVLDIREMQEIETSGLIEGSHALPFSELEERLIQLPPFGTIVLYADASNLNIEPAVKMLWENGFSDMFFVDGGYQAILESYIEWEKDAQQKTAAYAAAKKLKGFELVIKDYVYSLRATEKELDKEAYKEIAYAGFSLYFPHTKFRMLEGLTISFEDEPKASNPRTEKFQNAGSLKQRVQSILDEEINPSVASHGGYVRLIDVQDDIAYIEMGGGCQGCGMSAVTLKQGIEATILNSVPEIVKILDTTDHEAGTNPYYKAS